MKSLQDIVKQCEEFTFDLNFTHAIEWKSKAGSPIASIGGMAMNSGMIQAIKELADEAKLELEFRASPDAIYAGAIGSAIWAGFRYFKLALK